MGFKHHKSNGHENQDSMWTSMSDLFLGMTIIFLLLYMTALLHQGTDAKFKYMENQKLSNEVSDLRGQLKAYNALKQNYMKKDASEDEQESYSELMDKLKLLQEEAKDERNKLQQAASDNDKKAVALNKYQQMIRNIIDANAVAKARIKNRDVVIDERDDEITEQTKEISNLEKTVNEKKTQIAKGNMKIAELEDNLEDKLEDLQKAFDSNKITKKKFEERQAALENETEQKVAQLRKTNDKVAEELSKANKELAATEQQLDQTQEDLQSTQVNLAKVGKEKEAVQQELAGAESKHANEVAKLRSDFANQAAKEKTAFDDQLKKEKLTGTQKAAKEAQFRADAERKAKDLEGKISSLEGDKKQLQGQTAALKGDLAKAMENLNAKKKLAENIKKSFAAKGVKADVDPNTGDVLLSFGDQYFDTGQDRLKKGMKEVLEQAMPLYAESLFENGKIADKIQSVEIVGFASPTYKGKVIDPTSLSNNDRAAVQYNMDLSYKRAKAIFNHVFDREKMDFRHQQKLLPIIKVTGRSFLATDKDRGVASSTSEDFCRKNDCAKQQRVIIKFNLKD